MEMTTRNAKTTFLRLIAKHEGEWSWYQFERAFPPGSFLDEAPSTTAKQILDRIVAEGLATATAGEPLRKYRLTSQGIEAAREAAIDSTDA